MDQLLALLLSLIVSVTGIARTVDPVLVENAQQRAVQVQTNWSHEGLIYEEILHKVPLFGEAAVYRAVEAWMESEPHRLVMTDVGLTRIGCAIIEATVALGTYLVCVFARAPVAPVEVAESVITLPNTATK